VEEAGVHGENHRPWASNWLNLMKHMQKSKKSAKKKCFSIEDSSQHMMFLLRFMTLNWKDRWRGEDIICKRNTCLSWSCCFSKDASLKNKYKNSPDSYRPVMFVICCVESLPRTISTGLILFSACDWHTHTKFVYPDVANHYPGNFLRCSFKRK
jgi:hypothetical protein